LLLGRRQPCGESDLFRMALSWCVAQTVGRHEVAFGSVTACESRTRSRYVERMPRRGCVRRGDRDGSWSHNVHAVRVGPMAVRLFACRP
jgi:hypothetical protein